MFKIDFFSRVWLLTFLLAGSSITYGQRQLVLLGGDHVVHRFNVGESFYCKLKTDNKFHWGFLVELDEFSFITSQDTIKIGQIKKVLKPGKPFLKKVGKTLVIVGVGFTLIDQANYILVHGNWPPHVSKSVWRPSAILVGLGLPFSMKSKDWSKLGGSTRLMSVDKSSRFYRVE